MLGKRFGYPVFLVDFAKGVAAVVLSRTIAKHNQLDADLIDLCVAKDNTVTLPGYTRADAAFYFSLTERMRLQTNVENLFGTRYYINADSNTNISPGSSRAVRVALTTRF